MNVNANRITFVESRKLSKGERELRKVCSAILALDYAFCDDGETLFDVAMAYNGMGLRDAIESARADLEMTLERNESTDYVTISREEFEREESEAFWRENENRYA